MEEIFRSYLILFLNNTINSKEKIVLARDALEIVSRMLDKHKDAEGTIPYNKMLLLKEVATLYEKGINNIDAFNKIFFKGSKWVDFRTDIESIMSTEYNETEIDEFKRNLIFEKEYLSTEVTIQRFKTYLDKVESRSFDNIYNMQSELRSIAEDLYMDFVRESNLAQSLDGVTEIDFQNPEMLLEKMYEFYDGRNFISTGFKNIDELFGGGLEATRIYILAGKPGSGKSTFLLNFFYNMSESILLRPEFKDRYILYVTLENLGLETMQRLTSKVLHITNKEMNLLIRNRDKTFRESMTKVIKDMSDRGARIAYFPAKTIGPIDILAYIDKLNAKTGKKPLCVMVDYLDIMKLNPRISEYRHQLGEVTLGLKSIAVQYKIPVVTVTQLTKDAYNGKPTLSSIKESSEKIDHADAIGLLQRLDNGTDVEEHINSFGYNVELSFDKSRASGNGTLRFAMDPSKFDIQMERPTNGMPTINMGPGAKKSSGPVFQSPSNLVSSTPKPPIQPVMPVPDIQDDMETYDDFSI